MSQNNEETVFSDIEIVNKLGEEIVAQIEDVGVDPENVYSLLLGLSTGYARQAGIKLEDFIKTCTEVWNATGGDGLIEKLADSKTEDNVKDKTEETKENPEEKVNETKNSDETKSD